ncbi:MAG: endonuclease [Prevotella sp.]|jgi:endonuclease/exonuclease/phosphatase family metal-dependent hydrolase
MIQLLLASLLTLMELNVENLFDCEHDSLKNDVEFLPDGSYHWTRWRYWTKLQKLGKEIMAVNEWEGDSTTNNYLLPDLVALCEVENDSCMFDLTKRSLLRRAGYQYVMTKSPDQRGIDVALLYSPFSFGLINSRSIRIPPMEGMKPTRDILYASGVMTDGDTLHVFVVHAPSRAGGESRTRPFRLHVAEDLCKAVDSVRAVSSNPSILIAGDFNDYSGDASIRYIVAHGLTEVSAHARGRNGAKGTYCYRGEWGSLDHIFAAGPVLAGFKESYVYDALWLLETDEKYNGVKPRRNYAGPSYKNGYSDHLPVVARFDFGGWKE